MGGEKPTTSLGDKPHAALPAVPPAPGGERVEATARGLATLIAGLDSAVINHRSAELAAMVVVIEGRVIDAIAQTPQAVVKGVEVLDELIEVQVNALEVTRVEPRLAQVLPAYWRAPGAAREIVQSFIRPGRRGAIAVAAPSGSGVLLFDEQGVVASYRDGERKPGTDALDDLLSDPDVVLSARADSAPPPAPRPVENGRVAATQPLPRPPEPPRRPEPPRYPEPSTPAPAQNAPQPVQAQAAPPQQAQLEARRQAIVEMVRSRLGRLAGPVEQQFQAASSIDELVAAADRVRAIQLRMVNPLTLQGIAEDAEAIARGEPPKA